MTTDQDETTAVTNGSSTACTTSHGCASAAPVLPCGELRDHESVSFFSVDAVRPLRCGLLGILSRGS